MHASCQRLLGGELAGHVLVDVDGNAVSETPDDECVLSDFDDLSLLGSPRLECKTNVELDACSASHLSHSVSAVDIFEHTFDVLLG